MYLFSLHARPQPISEFSVSFEPAGVLVVLDMNIVHVTSYQIQKY